MTKEQLAAQLHGCEYGSEMTKEQIQQAAQNNLVVVFGYSDDVMELRGAIMDECSTDVLITRNGLLEECTCHCKYYVAATKQAKQLLAVWDPGGGYSWMYKTDIPHASFDVLEGEDKYCRGIVFSLNDV